MGPLGQQQYIRNRRAEDKHNKDAIRKAHRCSWCAEQIEVGQPYKRWRYFGDDGPTVCKLHPECAEAERESAQEWGNEEWSGLQGQSGRCCGGEVKMKPYPSRFFAA